MKDCSVILLFLKYFISILSIPMKDRSLKLRNTDLWREYKYQKAGDRRCFVELNDDTKINIELQIRTVKHWDKRKSALSTWGSF